MPAYVIGDFVIRDAEKYEAYRSRVLKTIEQYGGRFLVRGGAFEKFEGAWDPKRLVVLEFPNRAVAKAWYDSPEYAPLIALRQEAAEGSLLVVDGVA